MIRFESIFHSRLECGEKKVMTISKYLFFPSGLKLKYISHFSVRTWIKCKKSYLMVPFYPVFFLS